MFLQLNVFNMKFFIYRIKRAQKSRLNECILQVYINNEVQLIIMTYILSQCCLTHCFHPLSHSSSALQSLLYLFDKSFLTHLSQ